jgi:hypothetical protein
VLPVAVRRGSRVGMAGSKAPPLARPRVALVVGRTGVPLRISSKEPVWPLPPFSVKAACYLRIVKSEQPVTTWKRICNDSAQLGRLGGVRDTRGPSGLGDAYQQG